MQDIKLNIDEQGLYDLSIGTNGDFETVDGMETAILTSIFTDERAESSLVPNAERRRGWTGSLSSEIMGLFGSTAWVYEQARNTQLTRNALKLAVQEAFSWMIRDNIARLVNVELENLGRAVQIVVSITANDNTVQRYGILWKFTDAN